MIGFGGKVYCCSQITREFHAGSLQVFWLSTLFSSKFIVVLHCVIVYLLCIHSIVYILFMSSIVFLIKLDIY